MNRYQLKVVPELFNQSLFLATHRCALIKGLLTTITRYEFQHHADTTYDGLCKWIGAINICFDRFLLFC